MDVNLSEIWRFLHWGPLTALGIIKCITVTTLYMNSMWWPPNKTFGGLLHQLLFICLSTVATFNYVMAVLTGPGFLPLEWHPKNYKDIEFLQYCKECKGYKAPRSHHCRKCNRCVKKMDHHCPWINNCVGWSNHAYFTCFLFFSILGSLHATIILSCAFYRGLNRYWYIMQGQMHLTNVQFTMTSIIMCIISMGFAIGVVIALGMLLYFQLKSIIRNQTGIEMWITEKALFRRHYNLEEENFIYPYDLGYIQNFREVFLSKYMMKGYGIEWPVIPGCDQYTLTREQLAQKQEKRARTKTFKCIRPASGSYIPIFSQGWRVCFSSPCTDEPRIRLQPEEIVKVTRFRKHWLFGQVEVDERNKVHNEECRRGWFPRRCVVELIETYDDEITNKEFTQGNGHYLNNEQNKKNQ